MRYIAIATSLLLIACTRPAVSAPAPARVTIPDVPSFLAQVRCVDGALQVAEPSCAGAAPQRGSDPMLMRRFDWGAPGAQPGYVAQDGFVRDDGQAFVNTWDFGPPYSRFPDPAFAGDGGEVYVVSGGTVRISITQDGGKPYLQGFYGAGCGGTGWVAFRNDAPTGAWASLTARLRGLPVPSACDAHNTAFTRYRLEQVAIPFIVGGVRRTITLPTVISEHYDGALLLTSRNMERFFFAKGVGRAIWEAWTRGPPAGTDLAVRCPGTAWSAPPAPGWTLSDCRYATKLVATDGTMSGDTFGWPPPVAAMP